MREEERIKKEAFDLVNKIYQPTGYLKHNENSKTLWEWSKERVKEQAEHFTTKMIEGSSLWLYHRKLIKEIDKL